VSDKELRKALKMGPTLINLVGREEFRKKAAAELIVKTMVDSGTEDFNLLKIRTEKPTSDDLTEVQQEPFSSDYKVVFCYGSDLKSILRHKGAHTVIVSWRGKISKAHLDVDCKRLSGARLKTWLRAQAKSKGFILDKTDSNRLVETFGNDLNTLMSTVTKLSLLTDVTGDKVLELCSGQTDSNVWKLVEAVKTKKTGQALDVLASLKQAGSADLQIVGALSRQFRLLLKQEAGQSLSEELSEVEANKLAQFKGRANSDQLLKVLGDITQVEWGLKTGAFGSEKLVSLTIGICKEI